MFTTIADTRLHYESRGDGGAIVFIHGLGGTCSIWHPQALALSSRHRTIAYDWSGSGCSSRPDRTYSVESWAVEAAGLCRALRIGSAVMVGHSLGAAVAVTVAARFPQLVRGIALLGPVLKLPEAAIPAIRDRAAKVRAEGMAPMADALPAGALAAATRESNPAVLALFRAMILANDPEMYARHCEALLAAGAAALLDQVRCPALLLAGDSDPTAPPAAVEKLAGALRGCRYAAIAGAAHAMQLDQPTAVTAELERFVESLA